MDAPPEATVSGSGIATLWRAWLIALCLVASRAPAISVPTDAEILKQLKEKLATRGDYVDRKIQRMGNKTIEFESLVSTEADFGHATTILSDFSRYGKWGLTNINNKPSGGTYLLKVLNVEVQPKSPQTLITTILFDLPLLKHELRCYLNLHAIKKPDVYTILGDVDGAGTYIESVEMVFKMFPAEKTPHRVWIYAKAIVKIRNWLLYEAMPDQLLKRETGERLQIVLDNYLREEDRFRAELEKKNGHRQSRRP